MKAGYDLRQLAAEIERRAEAKKDLIAMTTRTEMFVGANDEVRIGVSTGNDQGLDFGINKIAHRQIQSHANIPAVYYDRMKADAPALLAANVNTWFKRDPKKRMLRTLDGDLRAFLSNGYRPLENEDLARAVLPVLMDLQLDVMSSYITDQKMYIKAVDPAVTRALAEVGAKFGDGSHNIVRVASPALTVTNSEVGMGALEVLVAMYDKWCSNLASFGERSARKYHIGARHELGSDEAYALLTDETRRKTDVAFWAQIRDVTKGAFNRDQFEGLCRKVDETRQDKIQGDVVEVVNLASKKFGWTEAEGGDVLKHLIEGGDLSRFGLYNAVTRASQDRDDYDRASEFERQGGQIIELPRTEWESIGVLKKAA